MPRREYTLNIGCAEPRCPERTFYLYDLQRDYREGYARQQNNPWKCLRHSHPEEVVGPQSPHHETSVAVVELKHGRFFQEEGHSPSSGIITGPGFRLFAKDFEPGTRIQFTVIVEPPEKEELAS